MPNVPRRVVIVDDNEITRAGSLEVLSKCAGIAILGALDHEEARSWTCQWDNVDVAIVDAAAERDARDQFPGVAVVRQIRRHRTREQTTILVLTGHFMNDAVHRRMREADADLLFSRADVLRGDDLAEIVLHPERRYMPWKAVSNPLRELGLSDTSRVNEFVEHVHANHLDDALRLGGSKKQGPRSSRSRSWVDIRTNLSRAGRISAVNADGTLPRRDQTLPSITQLRRLYNWATRIKRDARPAEEQPD